MGSLRALLDVYEGQRASAPASASISSLEKMVRLQQKALTQAEFDLAAARARASDQKGKTMRDHAPDAEEIAEFLAQSYALHERPRAPAGLPDGTRLSEEQTRATAAFILQAGRRARGEEPIPLLPVASRVLPQMPEPPALTSEEVRATTEMILRAGKKARGELPLDEMPVSSRVIDQTVGDPAEVSAFILAAAAKARSKT